MGESHKTDYESESRTFESCRARQYNQGVNQIMVSPFPVDVHWQYIPSSRRFSWIRFLDIFFPNVLRGVYLLEGHRYILATVPEMVSLVNTERDYDGSVFVDVGFVLIIHID